MKTFLLGVSLLFSLSSFALEKETKLKCRNNICNDHEDVTYRDLPQRPLRFEDYQVGQCYVDMTNQNNPVFYKAIEAFPGYSKSVSFLKEVSHDFTTKVHVLEKKQLWERDLEKVKFSLYPCARTNTFFDAGSLDTCLSKKKVQLYSKIYCDIK